MTDEARADYLAWIRGRSLRAYRHAGRALRDELSPAELDALDAWIQGATFEAACFATDLRGLAPRPWWARALRALSRALWALARGSPRYARPRLDEPPSEDADRL